MFENIFKKNKYLDCHLMKHSIHFFYDNIRACCSNVSGPIFYPNYNGENVDWNYIYSIRKSTIKEINNFFNKNELPKCCVGCCEASSHFSNKPVENFENMIDKMYFHYHMTCNAKCTYCTYENIERGYKYKVLPLVKSLIDNRILSKQAQVYMSGGEITISSEFEELLSTLLNYLESKIEILTSGIRYCKSIEDAFIQNKCMLMISLDSSNSETYKKIKQVDCFDKVVANIKNYIKATDNAKENITMKYIIVDGVNDTTEEILSFIKLVKSLGLKKIRLDFDYEKYKFTGSLNVPKNYYNLYNIFNKVATEENLSIQHCGQIDAILNKSN